MKKLFLALTFICISLTGLNAQSQKIAFVNTQLIMDTIPQTDSVQTKLAFESQKWQKKMQDLQAELQSKKLNLKNYKPNLEKKLKSNFYKKVIKDFIMIIRKHNKLHKKIFKINKCFICSQ